MIRVVIDTSALVSAVLQGRLRPYVTPVVLEEYSKVFEYERLKHLDRNRILRLRQIIERAAVKVKSRGNLKLSSHEDNQRPSVARLVDLENQLASLNYRRWEGSA